MSDSEFDDLISEFESIIKDSNKDSISSFSSRTNPFGQVSALDAASLFSGTEDVTIPPGMILHITGIMT